MKQDYVLSNSKANVEVMNRRGFLGLLSAALTLDPERLLWRPGAKLISIPQPRPIMEWVNIEVNVDVGYAQLRDTFPWIISSASAVTVRLFNGADHLEVRPDSPNRISAIRDVRSRFMWEDID